MVEEVEQKDLREALFNDGNQVGGEESAQSALLAARIAELESLSAQRDEELAKAKAQVSELEQVIASHGSEIASLKQSKQELEERLQGVSYSLTEAIASYKAIVIKANPAIEELIIGDTIGDINESLSKAKILVNKIRQGLEAEISSAMVPAGAPERASPDLSALSPREKIQYAIRR